MARTSRYSQEVRERAVRMVFDHRDEYDSEWEAIGNIPPVEFEAMYYATNEAPALMAGLT